MIIMIMEVGLILLPFTFDFFHYSLSLSEGSVRQTSRIITVATFRDMSERAVLDTRCLC